jgi:dTDP-4-amino-4,6-dideoxygalactose transaminase
LLQPRIDRGRKCLDKPSGNNQQSVVLNSTTVRHREEIRTADPHANYLAYRAEIDAAIAAVLEGSEHVLGPVVERFERDFAASLGQAHGVGVNSGTDALHLALRGLGIGRGDEVIAPSFTSVATIAAIEMCGASPVLAEVEEDFCTIAPEAVASLIGPNSRAVIAVHLYGQPAALDTLSSICARHGLALVEDCAQSHGARWRDKPAGSFGSASCFSFYPSKNLGTVGDGGLVATADAGLAERVAMLRQYGWKEPQMSLLPGWNSRLGPLQAAILQAKLRHLPAMVEARRRIASVYHRELAGLPLMLPHEREGSCHAYHLYVIRCESGAVRQALRDHLARHGVMAGIHYQAPVHRQPAYEGRLRQSGLDVTERLAGKVLSLPIYPELPQSLQEKVIGAVRSFFRGQL